MGFFNKMAAKIQTGMNGGPPGQSHSGGGYQQGGPGYQQGYGQGGAGGQQQQQQYGGPPASYPQHQPQPGFGGAPPGSYPAGPQSAAPAQQAPYNGAQPQQPPQASQYGAAPAGFAPSQQPGGAPVTPGTGPGSDFLPLLRANLTKLVATNSLQAFYPPQRIEEVLARLVQVDFRSLAAKWNMPAELAIDVAALALYDVVVMADDSTSMKYADDGARIGDLDNILARVAEVACLFDHDGISIRAINSKKTGDGIRTGAEADAYVRSLKFSGMTALGTAIEERVILPFVVQRAQNHTLSKPVLLITITDGEPTNEPEHKVFQVIKRAKDFMSQTPYGPKAIAFEFAQVGKDQEAQEFLGRLDNDPVVGPMVDATSYFELEAEEYRKKGVVLTPDLWLVKLMVGAVDPTYDEQD